MNLHQLHYFELHIDDKHLVYRFAANRKDVISRRDKDIGFQVEASGNIVTNFADSRWVLRHMKVKRVVCRED